MDPSEKRVFQRRTLDESERYLIEYKEAGKFFQKKEVALTINVSASGLLFKSNTLIAINKQLSVDMNIPHLKKSIHLTAQVVRIDPSHRDGIYNIAVRFIQISEADRNLINQFCLEHKENSAIPEGEAKKS